jgi:DNA polymerase-3 subunit beta
MVKIEAAAGAVTFTATDCDLEAHASAEADIETAGAIAASAETLIGFARKLAADLPVSFALESGQLIITSGRARLSVPVLPASDFPTFAALDSACRFTIEAAALRRLIDKTRFAISNEATRYYLNGLYLHTFDGELVAVATDGHRMALASTDMPPGIEDGEAPSIIIPRHTVAEIRKLIADHDGPVDLAVSHNALRVEAGAAALSSKAIDGSFPDYRRIIPKAPPQCVTVSRAAFAEALARAVIVSTEKSRSLRLTLGADALNIRAFSVEIGEAVEDIDATCEAGLDIGFNGKYLLEALASSDGEDCVLRLTDSGAPACLEDPADEKALVVLMPLRV